MRPKAADRQRRRRAFRQMRLQLVDVAILEAIDDALHEVLGRRIVKVDLRRPDVDGVDGRKRGARLGRY